MKVGWLENLLNVTKSETHSKSNNKSFKNVLFPFLPFNKPILIANKLNQMAWKVTIKFLHRKQNRGAGKNIDPKTKTKESLYSHFNFHLNKLSLTLQSAYRNANIANSREREKKNPELNEQVLRSFFSRSFR